MPAANGLAAPPSAPRPSDLGLYLHVPFCASICNYCNFNRGLFDATLAERYVAALEREIATYADGSAVDTVYFGGGTPSQLKPAEIARLLKACREAFAVTTAAEITIEANPEDLTPAYLEGLRVSGVNRLSIGVQSWHDEELRRLDRRHTGARARVAVEDARRAGFDNVSLDLMMWLPEQSMAAWRANVETLVDVGPEHASIYILEIYPNAPIRDAMARNHWESSGDDVAADMYLEAFSLLEAAGYRQYEISNAARVGRVAQHNLKYWTDGAWLGLGAGAHGTRHRVRWRNAPVTGDYIACVEGGQSAVADRRALSREEALADALFMGLRLSGGIDLNALGTRYDCDIMSRFGHALEPYRAEGLVALDADHLRLTRRGMLMANEVLTVFV